MLVLQQARWKRCSTRTAPFPSPPLRGTATAFVKHLLVGGSAYLEPLHGRTNDTKPWNWWYAGRAKAETLPRHYMVQVQGAMEAFAEMDVSQHTQDHLLGVIDAITQKYDKVCGLLCHLASAVDETVAIYVKRCKTLDQASCLTGVCRICTIRRVPQFLPLVSCAIENPPAISPRRSTSPQRLRLSAPSLGQCPLCRCTTLRVRVIRDILMQHNANVVFVLANPRVLAAVKAAWCLQEPDTRMPLAGTPLEQRTRDHSQELRPRERPAKPCSAPTATTATAAWQLAPALLNTCKSTPTGFTTLVSLTAAEGHCRHPAAMGDGKPAASLPVRILCLW